jgi:hypothetical protein
MNFFMRAKRATTLENSRRQIFKDFFFENFSQNFFTDETNDDDDRYERNDDT